MRRSRLASSLSSAYYDRLISERAGHPMRTIGKHVGWKDAARATSETIKPAGARDRKRSAQIRPFDLSLPMALLRAREAVMVYFRTLHRHAGISEQQWRTLRALLNSGPVDVTTLAQRTYLQMPSLSRILKNLEARGLIERRVQKSDQRRSLISISGRGRDLIQSEGPNSERQYAMIRDRFGADRLRRLYGLLEELEHALSENGQKKRASSLRETRKSKKDIK